MPRVTQSGDKINSLKLEYNLTEHCNYACNDCSHFSPYMPRKSSSLATFERDLRALAKVIRVNRFRFVGGEPLLHPELLGHIEAVRATGIAREIQVCTNGALLDRTPEAVFAAIDTLTISWYPDTRCDQAKIDRASEACRRHGTKLGVLRVSEFRHMQIREPLPEAELTQAVFDTCEIAHRWYCQTFYEGRFYLCSRPLFTRAYLDKLGANPVDFRKFDGVPLHEPDLKRRLLELMRAKRPMASCYFCLGTVGRNRPWRQLSASERKAPSAPTVASSELIDGKRLRYLQLTRRWPGRSLLLMAPSFVTKRAAALFSVSLRRT